MSGATDYDKWHTYVIAAHRAAATLAPDVRAKVMKIVDQLCDLSDEHQVPPRVMAAVVASVVGMLGLADVRGNVHDDEGLDDFLMWATAAMSGAVASARLSQGWTPTGPS